jgi:hypothetical protein
MCDDAMQPDVVTKYKIAADCVNGAWSRVIDAMRRDATRRERDRELGTDRERYLFVLFS